MRRVAQCSWHREVLNEHELLPLSLMPAAGRPQSTEKEAVFFFQTAGNPAPQASTNNADLFLPQLMCI